MSEISLDQKEAQLEVSKQDQAPGVEVKKDFKKTIENPGIEGKSSFETGEETAQSKETEGSKYTTESEDRSEKLAIIKKVYNK